jgi:4-hydroxythreonine-4-phosphate dehydrogenase
MTAFLKNEDGKEIRMGKQKPIIGITMGDPAGCGPELTVKAWLHPEVFGWCNPLVIADIKAIEDAVRIVRADHLTLRKIKNTGDAVFERGVMNVLHLDLLDMEKFAYGKVSAMCGESAYQCVKKVIELALCGDIDATVTNAINKRP